MPFTLAHPAAAIPLHRPLGRLGVLSALVIGSMVPDFVYFVPLGVGRSQSHSFLGLFWFCVPLGVGAYMLFHLVLAPALAYVLPEAVRSRVEPRSFSGIMPIASMVGVFVSLWIGAATHLVWDSATHASGFIVNHVPGLRVMLFEVGGYRVFTYKLFQHGSTLFGGMILVYLAFQWFQSASVNTTILLPVSTHGRWVSSLMLFAVPAVAGALSGIMQYEAGDWLESLREPLAQFVFTGGTTFATMWLLLGIACRVRNGDRLRTDRQT